MHPILSFIVAHLEFLWEGARFRISDSEVTLHNGGDALVEIESLALRLRFTQEKGQLFLDLRPTTAENPKEWFSVDLVYRLVTGTRPASSLLDERYADFLENHLPRIEELFSEGEWQGTRASLRKLAKLRAKEMFG